MARGLDGVLLFLPGHERAAAGPVRPGPADLDLGAVDAQVHAFGGGVGEHVGQRAQPQPGRAGNGEAPRGEQWPDLTDGTGDGRAVYAVKQRESGVRELEPQDDQGGDDPVGEYQVVTGTGADGALALMTAPIMQPGFLLRRPRPGQFGDQLAQTATRKASADTIRQGRASPC
jgi:hypothetical protein